jgi:[ribosomal protein S5]-alanine N-acetyltransferase
MELKGTGFTLRNWKKGDEASLQKHADNPNVSRFLMDRFPSPYTMEDAKWWVNNWAEQNPVINFAIAIDDKAAGGIGLEPRDDIYYKTGLLGYWLGEEFWGRSIMTEAVKLVTAYGFEHLDIIRIQAGIISKNRTSMRVLEKAGYAKEGILKNAVIKNGEILDEHVYAILKS